MTKKIVISVAMIFGTLLLIMLTMLLAYPSTADILGSIDDVAFVADDGYVITRNDNEPLSYPHKSGYMFVGWYYKDDNGDLQPYVFEENKMTNDIFAKYEKATDGIVYEISEDELYYIATDCNNKTVTQLVVPDYYTGDYGTLPVGEVNGNLLSGNTVCNTILVGNEVEKINYLASDVHIDDNNYITDVVGCDALKNVITGRNLVYITTASLAGCNNARVNMLSKESEGWYWRGTTISPEVDITTIIGVNGEFSKSDGVSKYNAILGRNSNSGVYDIIIAFNTDDAVNKNDDNFLTTIIEDEVGVLHTISEPGAVPYKSNYMLEGWYTKKSCNPGSKVTFPYKTSTSVTFYAKFVEGTLDNSYYQYKSTGNYIIKAMKYAGTDTEVVIPDYYDDGTHGVLKVTSVDGTSKNALLFGNTAVRKVYIGRNVGSLGSNFANSSGITDIIWGYSTGVNPGRMSNISASAFSNCTGLKGTLILPDTLTHIGSHAFYDCTNITGSLYIPENVYDILDNPFGRTGISTFIVDPNNPDLTSRDDEGNECNYIVDKTNKKFILAGKVEDLVIPEGVEIIGGYACIFNYTLKSVTLPSTLVSMESYTFYHSGLTCDLIIPDNVTTIGPYAFNSTNITSVILGSSLKNIGMYAFAYCNALTGELVIPRGVTTIANYAFRGCTAIQGTLTIPASVEKIENHVFYECRNINDLVFEEDENEDTTLSIGQYAFYSCTGITSYPRLPEGLVELGDYAFLECNKMTGALHFPASLTSIGINPFKHCINISGITVAEDNPVYTSKFNGSEYNAVLTRDSMGIVIGCASTGYDGQLLPDGIREIGTGAFSYIDSFANLTDGVLDVPSSVKIISQEAFRGCNSLVSVNIPSSVVTIGDNPFAACQGLTKITVDPNNSVYSSTDSDGDECNVIVHTPTMTLISGFKNSIIPQGIKSINRRAFYNCAIEEVVIPASVESIGNSAFISCFNLTTLVIEDSEDNPSQLKIIDGVAFQNCYNLLGVLRLPDSVESIGNYAFRYCTSLTGLSLGSGVTTIGESAFYGCEGITELIITQNVSSIGNNAFYGCKLQSVKFEEGVTTIGNSAFSGSKLLKGELTIPYTVTTIGSSAFNGCTRITSIVFQDTADKPSRLETIGSQAFYNCTGLTGSLDIPDSVTKIDTSAFRGCSGITSLTIGRGVVSIEASAFYKCTGLKTILIEDEEGNPSKLEMIGQSAFDGCTSLEGVLDIPDSVKTISIRAFADCSGLSGVLFGSGVTSIEDRAFFCCNISGELVIPDSVIVIGESAFAYNNISSLQLGQNMQTISYGAFRHCLNLNGEVVISESVSNIGADVFFSTSIDSIVFEKLHGWKKASNEDFTANVSAEEIDLSNSTKNAIWLVNTDNYRDYYWRRSDN